MPLAFLFQEEPDGRMRDEDEENQKRREGREIHLTDVGR